MAASRSYRAVLAVLAQCREGFALEREFPVGLHPCCAARRARRPRRTSAAVCGCENSNWMSFATRGGMQIAAPRRVIAPSSAIRGEVTLALERTSSDFSSGMAVQSSRAHNTTIAFVRTAAQLPPSSKRVCRPRKISLNFGPLRVCALRTLDPNAASVEETRSQRVAP